MMENRDAPIESASVSVVSAISQSIGINTLKLSPIFADTDTFIFFNREILIKRKHLSQNQQSMGNSQFF